MFEAYKVETCCQQQVCEAAMFMRQEIHWQTID